MSLVDSTCIVRSLKAGLFDDGWYPGVFGSRRAVQLDAEFGCFTDAGTYFDDALSQNAECASPVWPATTKLTVAFNINADDPAHANDVIGRWGGGQNQLVLRVTGNGQLNVFLADSDTDPGSNYAYGVLTGTGRDRRVVVVYDGTLAPADRVAIYVDGVADSVTVVGTIPPALNPIAQPLYVGGEPGIIYSSCVLSNLGVSADALSGEALAAAHVSTPYEEMSPERQADWFSFWRLCQRSGTLDDSAGENHLTRLNSPGVAQGPTGRARLYVASSAQRHYRAHEAALATPGSFTFCAWVRHDFDGFWQRIALKGDTTGAGGEWDLFSYSDDNRLAFRARKGDDSGFYEIVDAAMLVPIGVWTLVEAYYDDDAKVIGTAVNGVKSATTPAPLGVFQGTNPLQLSSDLAYWDGAICRSLLTRRLLSDAERRDLLRAGEGRLYRDLPLSIRDESLVECWDGDELSDVVVGQHAGLDLTAVNSPTYTAGPGLSGPCVDRSPCKRIEDQSDFKRHATQPTMANQATWMENVQNGRPVLRGHASSYMWIPHDAGLSMLEPVTSFIVADTTPGGEFFSKGESGSAFNYGASMISGYLNGTFNNTDRTGPSASPGWHVLDVEQRAAQTAFGLDGAETTAAGTPDQLQINGFPLYIFARAQSGASPISYFAGDLGALLIVGSAAGAAVTAAEKTAARRYYRTRYGTP